MATRFHLLASLWIVVVSWTSHADGSAGRCYLCSQHSLAECGAGIQSDSAIYRDVLQYYTEPCNGQCIFFQDENRSIVRGCSWTYGHMFSKSTGWHEITPGVRAFFCSSHLCNNGTLEQPDTPTTSSSIAPLQPVYVMPAKVPTLVTASQAPRVPGRLRQCYSCTARFNGCGEFMNPRYASKYIRPCAGCCTVFRNPNDLNLITRDCSTSWPEVEATPGLHRILGSEAFFCEESLCNGIAFDFIMDIFHNRLPALMRFASPPRMSRISTHTEARSTLTTTTTRRTTINIDEDHFIWDDADLDDPQYTPTVIPSSTLPPVAHFDLIDDAAASSTVAGGRAVAEEESTLHWWSFNDTSLPSISTMTDYWTPANTTSNPMVTRLEYLSVDDYVDETETLAPPSTSRANSYSGIVIDMNSYASQAPMTTSNGTSKATSTYLTTQHSTERPTSVSTAPVSLVSSIMHMTYEEEEDDADLRNSTTRRQRGLLRSTTTGQPVRSIYEYCKDKQCFSGGRLNSDCLCICLPAYTGENCETLLCDQEPAYICSIVLEHECENEHIRFLCPKFCAIEACSPAETM